MEDISFVYGDVSDGDGSFLRVGAENTFGNSGANWYFDGTGTAVTNGSEVRAVSLPGEPGEIHTITFSVTGTMPGAWTNCAELTSNLFEGTNAACFSGEITSNRAAGLFTYLTGCLASSLCRTWTGQHSCSALSLTNFSRRVHRDLENSFKLSILSFLCGYFFKIRLTTLLTWP